MAGKTIWTTKSVEETIAKYRSGQDVDLSFFHERNTSLKGKDVSFQLTPDEKDEFLRCSMDISYFVGKYCKFLTDKGQTTVQLHKYQKDILSIVGEEVFDEELEDFAPAARNFILMAARQTGKCFSPLTKITLKNAKNAKIIKTSANNLHIMIDRNKNIVSRIKNYLYRLLEKLE